MVFQAGGVTRFNKITAWLTGYRPRADATRDRQKTTAINFSVLKTRASRGANGSQAALRRLTASCMRRGFCSFGDVVLRVPKVLR